MKYRPYVMKARADAKQETHQRILRAGTELLWEKVSPEITLDDIAERSGVSIQTVLRHFGTREKLFDAIESFLHQEVVAERQTPPGDVEAAIKVIFDHYELRGDAVMLMLAQEHWNERIRAGMDLGRRTHREWVERVFGPQVARYAGAKREELVDLLVVATDVYTWKLLRRDRQLERQHAEERVKRLIAAILAEKKGY
ncbi:MAG TPA: TetR/AcrR family transcriptional regulator [Ktedonobacterales bacterium]